MPRRVYNNSKNPRNDGLKRLAYQVLMARRSLRTYNVQLADYIPEHMGELLEFDRKTLQAWLTMCAAAVALYRKNDPARELEPEDYTDDAALEVLG